MPERMIPRYASDYTSEQLDRVYRTLRQVALVLQDFQDNIVLVGGLVPLFLTDQMALAQDDHSHIGTVDVDLGIHLGLIAGERYEELEQRLDSAGFSPESNDRGNPTKQKWLYKETDFPVVIDFLIDESDSAKVHWGRIMHLSDDLGAIRTLGLSLAFTDSDILPIPHGYTLDDDFVSRSFRICGPAAFVVLKALAFRNRGKRKDAYDLAYVLHHFPGGPVEVARRMAQLPEHPAISLCIEILQDDFGTEESTGPRRASNFLFQRVNPEYVADFVGDVLLFLEELERASRSI